MAHTGENPTFTSIQLGSGNTLSYYVEQQSWTPAIVGGTAPGVGTYTTQSGYYTRIGNMIFAQGALVWTAHTGTGDLLIGNFPFTCRNSSNYDPEASILVADIALPVGTLYVEAHMSTGNSQLIVNGIIAASAPLPVQIAAAGTIHFSVWYLT